ncbi:hypothetical protein BRL93_07565 [Xanthomonas oryzae pv. oryzae]|nr:hypothetical protein IXO141_16915 [Xanthomonas oryzae pv. oryzae]OLI94294.1 hypothetical protein IXO390_08575 [Xanthomonas oryzae pv. oryzae]OLK16794.1 hypothetical protein IXO621_19735 [Xanthomonas oryzae pv. oryzae]OLK43709.1 hypothetical protein IXO620_14185 [Xanthomonas oryzae pv. oryzae]RBH92672.1 hypothetical protein BRL93_07565 [Xanthomonas oryzae pv. oryzae]
MRCCTLHRFSKDAHGNVRKAPYRTLPHAAIFTRTAPHSGSMRRAGITDSRTQLHSPGTTALRPSPF